MSTPAQPRSPIIVITVVICLTLLLLGFGAGYIYISSQGRDPSGLVPILVGVLGGAIPGLVGLLRTESVVQDVATIRQQTNGAHSEMVAVLDRAVDALSTSTPADETKASGPANIPTSRNIPPAPK